MWNTSGAVGSNWRGCGSLRLLLDIPLYLLPHQRCPHVCRECVMTAEQRMCIGCKGTAATGFKYCRICLPKVHRAMRESGYLTPVPMTRNNRAGQTRDEHGDGLMDTSTW